MRAHNVIIVSSGQAHVAATDALDRLIRSIVQLNKNPILVLGPDGDDVLRTCSEIEHCDLVFDPNYNGGFFSSVKAGLHATTGAAFVVPLTEKASAEELKQLLSELETALGPDGSAAQCDVLRPVTQNNVAAKGICLVTPQGVRSLKNIAADANWESCEGFSVRCVSISPSTNC